MKEDHDLPQNLEEGILSVKRGQGQKWEDQGIQGDQRRGSILVGNLDRSKLTGDRLDISSEHQTRR